MKKLSVVTVVFNGEKTIERSIESVINQKNADIEYIIVDGASTDHTMDIVEKYRRQITHIISEPDDGIYDAMNKGIQCATGDIISFLNSDDWYEVNTLKSVVDVFDNRDIDILCADAKIVGEHGSYIRKAALERQLIFRQLPTSHQAIFATKKWFEKIGGFDIQYFVSADFEWMTRSLHNHCKVELLHQVVVNYSSGGFSGRYSDLCYEEMREIAMNYYTGTSLEADMRRYIEYRDYFAMSKQEVAKESSLWDNIRISIPEDKQIYIFGTGKAGTECYKLLEKLGYPVCGFIDNYLKDGQEQHFGKKVERLSNVQKEKSYIIISSNWYEDDMRKQLEIAGYNEKRDFDFYSRISEWIIRGGSSIDRNDEADE